ncbi:hypothetical protein RND71_021531 [Anisodus tanguticus]|uniref:Uncharacterized protein n=1 Tax=Anisodus tanguticus TaxID=243964 RepID=A0AAE1V8B9_9SOLA|nr:hypothetical protein RND71_021531 [Anisodus tanguticus]
MKLHDLLPQCLAVIFTVILIARISSCLDTEVLNEVSERVDKQSQDVQLFLDTCSSGVSNVLTQNCPCTLCNIKFAPKLSALHRKLIGEGSHQRLSSSLRLKMSSESTSGPPKSCERGVFRDAAVFGDTNLELPSFLSNRSLVEVHLEVGSNLTSQQKDELEIHMDTSSTCTLTIGKRNSLDVRNVSLYVESVLLNNYLIKCPKHATAPRCLLKILEMQLVSNALDSPMFESNAIARYVTELKSDNPLFCSSLIIYARIDQWNVFMLLRLL